MTADPVISLRDVAVTYEGRRILHGVNLDIARGETMVLLGGSGSGKSALLRQIIGLEQPDVGRVIVNNVDLANCSPRDLAKFRRSVGVAFQSAALFNSLSIEENIALPLREHSRLPESTIRLMVWLKLAVVGLADSGKLSPQALSGVRLLRPTNSVRSPHKRITSRSLSTARNLPSRIAAASAMERRSSCVAILPLWRIRSAGCLFIGRLPTHLWV